MTAPQIRHRTWCTDPTVRATVDALDHRRRYYCPCCRAEAYVIGGQVPQPQVTR